MRLGIRRKLIGTLMLVGLFPLVISLVVIMGGGAALQLSKIQSTYIGTASDASGDLAMRIRGEVGHVAYLARLPETVEFVRRQNELRSAAGPVEVDGIKGLPVPDADARVLDGRWKDLTPNDAVVSNIMKNPLAERMRLFSEIDNATRQMLVTNAAGELIAADAKTGDFFQADEAWWEESYAKGKGRVYVSTLVTNPATGQPCVELAVPVMDRVGAEMRVIGIVKDKLDVNWLEYPIRGMSARARATGQLIDLESGKTVYSAGSSGLVEDSRVFYLENRGMPHIPVSRLLFKDLVLGSSVVKFDDSSPDMAGAKVPQWVVVVSNSSSEAMKRVYQLAGVVAVVGLALIVVLFVLGVAISNREVIMPILRLREATAAVGRGELNVRLLSDNPDDKTFRKDELGDLAKDFDEMTRQLQKNVNQLARSNEAKRRFMELAGHELRTPVTYILGVCQLAQRQMQEEIKAAGGVAGGGEGTTGALAKIGAKTQRLSRIIDNLLKLVSNDQFTTRMNKSVVHLGQLVEDVASDYRPFLTERKQQLVVEVAEGLPTIEGDRDKLEDVLNNLISNAIRFSPDGGVVKVTARKVVGEMLELGVEDSGPGIKQEDLENLFQPFYTGTDILHHHSGDLEFGSKGLGLGLAVVRRFVELHGGVVRAQVINEGGRTGTRFQILLPLPAEEGK